MTPARHCPPGCLCAAGSPPPRWRRGPADQRYLRLMFANEHSRTLAVDRDGTSVVVSYEPARNDVTSVWQWTPKEEHELPGVAGYASDVGWVDEDTALVTTGQDLWVCETLDRSCGRLTLGGSGEIRISR